MVEVALGSNVKKKDRGHKSERQLLWNNTKGSFPGAKGGLRIVNVFTSLQ